jgi:hypothetical protein
MKQLYSFSNINCDTFESIISVAFYALINIDNHNKELIKNYHAQWFSVNNCPKLVYNHQNILEYAIRRLRNRTSVRLIGFELLPKKFTIRQFVELYEAILVKEIDKRNFISKINSLDVLIKLNEKDMKSSKKGSYLYTFDKKKYDAKSSVDFILNF